MTIKITKDIQITGKMTNILKNIKIFLIANVDRIKRILAAMLFANPLLISLIILFYFCWENIGSFPELCTSIIQEPSIVVEETDIPFDVKITSKSYTEQYNDKWGAHDEQWRGYDERAAQWTDDTIKSKSYSDTETETDTEERLYCLRDNKVKAAQLNPPKRDNASPLLVSKQRNKPEPKRKRNKRTS